LIAEFPQHCWREARLHSQKHAQSKAELRNLTLVV